MFHKYTFNCLFLIYYFHRVNIYKLINYCFCKVNVNINWPTWYNNNTQLYISRKNYCSYYFLNSAGVCFLGDHSSLFSYRTHRFLLVFASSTTFLRFVQFFAIISIVFTHLFKVLLHLVFPLNFWSSL